MRLYGIPNKYNIVREGDNQCSLFANVVSGLYLHEEGIYRFARD